MPLPLRGRERRPITILFADVVGSTSLAEGMDAEDWTTIIQPALDRMLAAVKRYEGHVAQVQGDGILAIFGAPEAHEDDPERAVRAGLDMVDSIGEYAPRLAGREPVHLQIRVGVNTGTAVVGPTDGIGQDYTAFGDAVNVAARIQSEARPGVVLITAATHAALRDVIEAEPRGAISVKGKTQLVEAWEVIAWKGSLRRRRGLPGLSSSLVGRDHELARLVALLPIVAAGRGRLAVITGEPGIGKSRLLHELRDAMGGVQQPEWHEGRCLSYGRALPHHLLLETLRSLLGLSASAEITTQLVRDRLTTRLASRDVDEMVPYLAHLLSAADLAGDPEITRLDGKALQDRYVERLWALLTGLATARPQIVVLEDVHWADEASVDMFERLLTVVNEAPIILVMTTRPDRDAPGWRLVTAARDVAGEALTELRLAGLDNDQSRTLIGHLLAIESLPAATREYILDRADGNPFFVEEVTRMLIDRGVILREGERWVASPGVQEVEIPGTIHGLLLARIDRLPDEARLTLRVASIVGRQFAARALSEVLESIGPGGDLGTRLGLLEAAGMIELAGVDPDLEYRFRHVLIQEAAYESILKQERRLLHSAVADVLERLHPERAEELHAVLAMHLEQAGEGKRAVDHYVAAAANARQHFANHEAEGFYLRAAALLGASQDADAATRRRRAEIGLERVDVGMTFTPADEQLRQLGPIRHDSEVLDDPTLLARVHFLTALVRTLRGEQYASSPDLRAALDQAVEYGRNATDPAVRGLPLALLGEARYRGSDFLDAVSDLEGAIPLLEQGDEIMQASLYGGTLALAYAHLGRFAEALGAVERAAELGRQSGDPTAILDADLARSQIEALLGNPEAAVLYAGRAAELADRVDNKACAIVARQVLGDQRLMRGALWEAIDVLEEGAQLSAYCDLVPVRIELSRALLDSARAAVGLAEPSADGFERAAGLARAIGDRLSEADVLRQRARHRLRTSGDREAALADFLEAERLFDALGARPHLAQTLREHADALSSAGRVDAATKLANRAAALLGEMGISAAFRRRDDIPSEAVAKTR